MIDCAFCDEFAQPTEGSWIVARSHNRVVLPTIGCLTEGYLLYMPVEHVLAFADLEGKELRICEQDLDVLRGALSRRYGPVIVAEHGPTEDDLGAGCCDHAHMHLIPVTEPSQVVDAYVRVAGPCALYSTLEECLASVEGAYVYLSPVPAEHYVWRAAAFPRQWARRVCAAIHGRGTQWDWRDHAFEPERQRTYDALVAAPLLPAKAAQPGTPVPATADGRDAG